jgi:GT2 family glycosyltransferase
MTTSPKMEQTLNKMPSGEHRLHPMVSIIMPVYNGAPYIAKAVRSVLQQTYPFWELIVVNDGSTDNTLDILAAFDDPRIQVVSQPNGGTATARNHAMGLAQGEFMALLDADDLWLPAKLSHDIALLDVLTRQGQSTEVVVYGWFYGIDDAGQLANFSAPFTQTGLLFEPNSSKKKPCSTTAACCFIGPYTTRWVATSRACTTKTWNLFYA